MFFFITILLTIPLAASVYEEDYGWMKYISPTGIFEVKIPDQNQTRLSELRNGPQTIISSDEIMASIDQRPYKNAVKSYIVRFDQTLSPGLTEEEKARLLERDIEAYVSHYASKGGVLKKRHPRTVRYSKGAEIEISYQDPEFGPSGIRASILYTDSTRLEQVLTGPERIINAIRSNQFFQTLDIFKGIGEKQGTYEDEWDSHISPLKIFSVLLPHKANPYIPRDPIITSDKNTDKITFIFNDPVRKERIFYNIYGYRTDEALNFADAENLLLHKHVAKHLKIPKGINIQRIYDGEVPIIQTYYKVPRHKKFPFIEVVQLNAMFLNNYMVVQEVVGSRKLVETDFTKNLLKQIEFHPKRAHENLKKSNAEKLIPKGVTSLP